MLLLHASRFVLLASLLDAAIGSRLSLRNTPFILKNHSWCPQRRFHFTSFDGKQSFAWSVDIEGDDPTVAIRCPSAQGHFGAKALPADDAPPVSFVPGSRLEFVCDMKIGHWVPKRSSDLLQTALEREHRLVGCYSNIAEVYFQELSSMLLWAHQKSMREVRAQDVPQEMLEQIPVNSNYVKDYSKKFGTDATFKHVLPRAENQLRAAAVAALAQDDKLVSSCRSCGLCRGLWQALEQFGSDFATTARDYDFSVAELEQGVPNVWRTIAMESMYRGNASSRFSCAAEAAPEGGAWMLPGPYSPVSSSETISVQDLPDLSTGVAELKELTIEWSDTHIRIKEAMSQPDLFPWALVPDTETSAAVAFGLGFKNSRKKRDHEQMAEILRKRGVAPVTLGDVHGKKGYNCGVDSTTAFQPWVRDYGMMFKKRRVDESRLDRDVDDGNASDPNMMPILYNLRLPEEFAKKRFTTPVTRLTDYQEIPPFIDVEGGNVYADGEGNCVSTNALFQASSCLESSNVDGLHNSAVRLKVVKLMTMLGCHSWIFLDAPDIGETGHVDIFMTQLDNKVFGLGSYRVIDDPLGSLILANNRRILEYWAPVLGWTIEEMPMPPNVAEKGHRCRLLGAFGVDGVPADCVGIPFRFTEVGKSGEIFEETLLARSRFRIDTEFVRVWRTWANALSVAPPDGNRFVLVPRYVGKAAKAADGFDGALVADALYEKYFPGGVLHVNQDARVVEGGSLRCLSRQIPAAIYNANNWNESQFLA
eukprot:TRINITY_DN47292_c0_g1_i1.p1 TRINITY_DN47292_c0_g1~~TRINITY_DN47292_c0_g1_i1.p1  ORF type:complete len:761 (+),score=101.89 TRINITY_DN47292_c0_g1_i1:65-2347(+)